MDASTHQAVANAAMDQVRPIRSIFWPSEHLFVTNSGVQNRLQDNRQTRSLVTNSYIEGDVDRPNVVWWCLITPIFRVVNSRTQKRGLRLRRLL